MISLRDPRATSLPEELPGWKLKSITEVFLLHCPSRKKMTGDLYSLNLFLLRITKRYTRTDIRYGFQLRGHSLHWLEYFPLYPLWGFNLNDFRLDLQDPLGNYLGTMVG